MCKINVLKPHKRILNNDKIYLKKSLNSIDFRRRIRTAPNNELNYYDPSLFTNIKGVFVLLSFIKCIRNIKWE